MIWIKQNDRRPAVSTVLTRGTTIVDLTLATSVTFKMGLSGADAGNLKVNSAAGIDPDPTTGAVVYNWASSDTDASGTYKVEWEVLWNDGTTETFPTKNTNNLRIMPDLDGSA